MARCGSVVKCYENMNEQQLFVLWNQFSRKGPTIDILREILLYYMHHKSYPPVMQKSCDTLLTSVKLRNVPKKIRNVIFQIMEEICVCLESSIIEQVSFASQSNIHSALFNCILVGGFVTLLDEITVDKLLSFLKNSEVPVDERGKLLLCLLVIHETSPVLISSENMSRLGTLMESWFRQMPNKPVASSVTFFGRSDSAGASEVDGNFAGDTFTVLTLANTFSDHHLMGIHCFSMIREWLGEKIMHQNRKLIESLRDYCSLVVEQCFRPARKDLDFALQKAVVCEVLDILNQLVQLDSTHGPQCLIMVKRIQNNIKEQFKGDYRDICIFVRVLSFLLNFGESTGYNSQVVCEYFLKDMIYRSYMSGLAAVDVIIFLVENKHKMRALQEPLLQRFFPNILKVLACNPFVVVEEFLELIPDFVSPTTAVEVFHSLVDLPVLSATLCLHQAPALARIEGAGSLDSEWATLLTNARSLKYQHIFNYFMRTESGQKINLDTLPEYMELLNHISNHHLMVTCCQIVPLLLEIYFREIEKWKDVADVAPIFLGMLSRLPVLFATSGYSSSIKKCFLFHIKQLFKVCHGLIFSISPQIIEYISSMKNYEYFPQLYIHMIYVIGEFSHISDWDNRDQHLILHYYEAIECIIYEILAQITSGENASLELLNVAGSAFAKLSSRYQDLIPRTVLCLNKIRVQFTSSMSSDCNGEFIVRDRIEELLCVLHHPNVANMIWSSPNSSTQVTSFVRVLAHITDS